MTDESGKIEKMKLEMGVRMIGVRMIGVRMIGWGSGVGNRVKGRGWDSVAAVAIINANIRNQIAP